MSRTTNAIGNVLLNFVVGFAVGSVVKDKSAGVKVGLVLAAVGAAAAYLLDGWRDEEDDTFFGIDRVRTTE